MTRRTKKKNLHVEPVMVLALKRGVVSERPWGHFTTYISNANGVTVKTMVINPGQRLSLQYHSKRSERWICLQGEATVEINGRKRALRVNQEVMVPVGAKHRLGAGPQGAMVLEIVQGEFSEGDIVRLEDDYRRA